jgi:hypothetical protein
MPTRTFLKMTRKSRWEEITSLGALALIVLAGLFIGPATPKSGAPKLILEVINWHFTVGQKISCV